MLGFLSPHYPTFPDSPVFVFPDVTLQFMSCYKSHTIIVLEPQTYDLGASSCPFYISQQPVFVFPDVTLQFMSCYMSICCLSLVVRCKPVLLL